MAEVLRQRLRPASPIVGRVWSRFNRQPASEAVPQTNGTVGSRAQNGHVPDGQDRNSQVPGSRVPDGQIPGSQARGSQAAGSQVPVPSNGASPTRGCPTLNDLAPDGPPSSDSTPASSTAASSTPASSTAAGAATASATPISPSLTIDSSPSIGDPSPRIAGPHLLSGPHSLVGGQSASDSGNSEPIGSSKQSAAPADRTSPQRIGRFVLEDQILGAPDNRLWRAHDELLNRTVAVRLIAADDPLREDLQVAACAAARVVDRYVVQVLDVLDHEGTLVIVTEWVDGIPLEQLLDEPLSPQESVTITRRVAQAISHIHAAGVTHGRLRPACVMIDQEGAVRLRGHMIDARIYGVEPGTDPAAADIAGIGALLLACLTGRWAGDTPTSLPPVPVFDGHWATPNQLRADLPKRLDTFVTRAMASASDTSATQSTFPKAPRREPSEHQIPTSGTSAPLTPTSQGAATQAPGARTDALVSRSGIGPASPSANPCDVRSGPADSLQSGTLHSGTLQSDTVGNLRSVPAGTAGYASIAEVLDALAGLDDAQLSNGRTGIRQLRARRTSTKRTRREQVQVALRWTSLVAAAVIVAAAAGLAGSRFLPAIDETANATDQQIAPHEIEGQATRLSVSSNSSQFTTDGGTGGTTSGGSAIRGTAPGGEITGTGPRSTEGQNTDRARFWLTPPTASSEFTSSADPDGPSGPRSGASAVNGEQFLPIVAITAMRPSGRGLTATGSPDAAVDDNLATAWHTPRYESPNVPADQASGLVVDLGQVRQVRAVTIGLLGNNSGVELRVAEKLGKHPLKYQLLQKVKGASTHITLREARPVATRYLLITLTSVPQSTGKKFQGGISTIQVRG